MVNKTGIKQYQQATRDRSKAKTEGGKIIRVEAHPIPEHPRPKRVQACPADHICSISMRTHAAWEGLLWYKFASKRSIVAPALTFDLLSSGESVHHLCNSLWHISTPLHDLGLWLACCM